MSIASQRICAWCGPAFMVLFGIGFWAVAGFLPPPSPDASAQEIASLYSENTARIRAGLAITMLAATLLFPWIAVISVQLKRIEGPSTPWANTQLTAGAVGFLLFTSPVFIWQTAAYRPDERSPEMLKMLNDLGWLPFVGIFTPAVAQGVAIALAILGDKRREPVFPRWVGYFNLWAVVMFMPATALPFFKDGLFAWDGLLALWVPIAVFGSWFAITFITLLRAIAAQEREERLIEGLREQPQAA